MPVPVDDNVVYVRVDEDAPAVTLYAAVLSDVRWTPRVGDTLNDVNKRFRYGRLVFHKGHVFLEHRLFCRPFVPALLRHAVEGMTGIVGRVEQDLQDRLGGPRLGDSENGAA